MTDGKGARLLLPTVARRLFLDRQAEFWARRLDGRWALDELRARVVAVVDETRDVKSFLLAAAAGRWGGHRAGQYMTVTVEIDGVRLAALLLAVVRRPAIRCLRITVKRVAAAASVSSWLHDRCSAGPVVRLGRGGGRLRAARRGAAEAALRHRRQRRHAGDVDPARPRRPRRRRGRRARAVRAQPRRTRSSRGELATWRRATPALRLVFALRRRRGRSGRVQRGAARRCRARLRGARATYLCGPPALMARVERMWDAAGASARLRERFAAPALTGAAPHGDGASRRARSSVQLSRSGRRALDQRRRHAARSSSSAPASGRAHGCRMGICNTCTLHQARGRRAQPRHRARVSSEPDEEIQLCISAPLSDLELGL